MGYFYAKPIELTSILVTQGGKSQLFKQFSEAHVTGPRYLAAALRAYLGPHVLVCRTVFIRHEALHRATLIGQTTGGGANPGGFVPLDPHFAIFVPLGRAVNPYTKTNWEGVGVVPDLATESAAALLTALYAGPRERAQSRSTKPPPRAPMAMKDPAKALARRCRRSKSIYCI